MRILKSFMFVWTICTINLNAQRYITIHNGCNSEGVSITSDSTIKVFHPSDEALNIVNFLLDISDAPRGIKHSIRLQFADIHNVLASTDGETRHLLLSNIFMKKFDNKRTFWKAYFMVAHELGHHLKQHNFDENDPYRIKYSELEADLFAGSLLRLLGATLEEAQYAVSSLPPKKKTETRPAISSRLEAMTVGWRRQNERMKNQSYEYPLKEHFLSMVDESSMTPKGIARSSSGQLAIGAMPNFPWPPPMCFLRKTLFSNLISKADAFQDVDDRLQRVLDANGYYQRSYYAAPGGFAIVTQMEQFKEDGSTKERYRWADYPVQDDFDDVFSYFKSLIMPNPGRFRVFVFLVTDLPYMQSQNGISQSEAESLAIRGISQMPTKVAETEVTKSHHLDVLIYEFESPQSTHRCLQKCPTHLDVQTHLLRSGLTNITGF